MLKKILLLLALFLAMAGGALAKVTVISGTSGSTINQSSSSAPSDNINDLTDIPGIDGSTTDFPPDINYTQDEDGFLVNNGEAPFMTEEEKAQVAKQKKIEEERNRPTQIYRGADANKPKLEPKRTHLMYQPTRY